MPVVDDLALDQLFRTARSYNGYTDRAVTNGDLEAMWALMKYGPTSANALPARILWCTTDAAKARLAIHASDGNKAKIIAAPVTAIIGMDLEFYELLPELMPSLDARSWFVGKPELIQTTALRNSSLQGAYLMLAARALGLDTGPMSGFDSAGVDAEFFGGTTVRTNFIATLGYGDPAAVYPRSPRPAFDRFNTIL